MCPLYTLILLSFLHIAAAVSSTTLPSSTDVFFWPIASPQPALLAQIAYDPSTLESKVLSYNPLPLAEEDGETEDLVRIGFFMPTSSNSKQWVGSLMSRSSLLGELNSDYTSPKLRLHLSPANEVFHVSFSLPPKAASSILDVDLVPVIASPGPNLNRPVIVSQDGKDAEVVIEKTFFQKYWWVFLIVAFLAMSGGGGGEGQQ